MDQSEKPNLSVETDYDDNLELQVEDTLKLVEDMEPLIQSLIPETDRSHRLRLEVEQLQSRNSDPSSKRSPSLLYGALLGVKDIISVDGFPTHAGSKLPPHLFKSTQKEASCVAKLREEAGILLLGKTETTEFAYSAPAPTRNPRNLEHTPGGSSSGSAAAVAAKLCHIALGTQTVGSVIRPASFCGIVGFKPSYGRIPMDGVVQVSKSLDHIGVFAQSVTLIEQVATILCDNWQIDHLEVARHKKPTLGIPMGPYLQQASKEGLADFEAQVALLEGNGYAVQRVLTLDTIEQINHHHRMLMAGEMAKEHDAWYAAYGDLYRPQTRALIEEGKNISTEVLQFCRDQQATLRLSLHCQMAEHGIDLWICPAAVGIAPKGIETTGDPVMNLPWTNAGLPVITIPAGYQAGLPLGLQCVGIFDKDEELLAWSENIESILKQRL